jgi:hypothetical protein
MTAGSGGPGPISIPGPPAVDGDRVMLSKGRTYRITARGVWKNRGNAVRARRLCQ